jgi:hypothetical protein
MTWDDFWAWLDFGVSNGWCSQSVCETHDGLPWTEEEMLEWDDGNDFCVPAVRLYGMEKVL